MPNCGFLYGGSSSVNDDGIPFKTVLERSFVTSKVKTTLKRIMAVKINAELTEETNPTDEPIRNMDIREMSNGNLPLQGTKLFVSKARFLSLGESIIRQPTTPAALHPNPMHIVKDCFPHAEHFLNGLSRLYAILGKYPESSRSVKRGKKMAMGGSMTDTTEASTP